jgi:hypothetical protein
VQQHHPITVSPGLRQIGLDQPPQPEPNLFLHAGWWQAACPSCGCVLVEGRSQAKVERKAKRAACPVCVEVA